MYIFELIHSIGFENFEQKNFPRNKQHKITLTEKKTKREMYSGPNPTNIKFQKIFSFMNGNFFVIGEKTKNTIYSSIAKKWV